MLAFLGLLVAIRSNSIIQQQNLRIDQQTLLIDAQRRASLNIELSSIWDQISEEVSEAESRGEDLPRVAFNPSNALSARIAAISKALTPYKFLDPLQPDRKVDADRGFLGFLIPKIAEENLVMQETPLSPERGQLLVALTAVGANVPLISQRGATFAYSDLREQVLSFPSSEMVDFSGSDLSGSILWRSDFTGSILNEVKFDCVYFEHVFFGFEGAPFFAYGATFKYVDFGDFSVPSRETKIREFSANHMSPAIFSQIDLTDSFLNGLRFVGYSNVTELPLPDSFDGERYTIVKSGEEFVVKAKLQASEKVERIAMQEYCWKYRVPESYMARLTWAGVLSSEWKR